jgi:type I restriction-modification system DNA methylase subunit
MTYEQAKKEFIATVTKGAYRFRTWEIFSDFCQMGAISLYQPFRLSEDLEEEYLKIIGKYNKEEVQIFPKLLSLVVMGLSAKMGDFLGECFHELNLGSKYKGQFFTPYYISKLMASILGESTKEIETMSEPACGAGGMIIARADVLQGFGINYQKTMIVQAVDIDSLCVHMCYIQLTLLHIPAEVVHGNSLSLEVFNTWYTPAYIMNNIHEKLQGNSSSSTNDNKIILEDPIENKVIPTQETILEYSNEQLEAFSKGKLF